MRPFGWALAQEDWCPSTKRKSGHVHAQREDAVRTQGEDGQLEDPGARMAPSLAALMWNHPCQHLHLGLLASRTTRQ